MSPSRKGRYEGRVIVELLDDGRIVRLVEMLAFIDCREKRWVVPSDARVDGASIPRLLWSIIGGPFEGRYRNASIIHDWYCDRRTEPWERVHEIFYEAMLTSGVSGASARLLYTGVLLGGPRWSATAVANNKLADRFVESPSAVFPAKPIALPGLSGSKNLSFAGPAGARPRKAAPGRPAVKAAVRKKPAAYRYEVSPADLKTIEAIAGKSTNLGEINRLVEQELKGRKRK